MIVGVAGALRWRLLRDVVWADSCIGVTARGCNNLNHGSHHSRFY